MANSNAIGFALEIPDSVFEQIKKAQDAIAQLEEQARTSADKINKSFMSIGSGGLQNFIQKLGEAKASMLAFDGTSSAGMKDFAANIVEAANALNKMGNSDQKIKKITDSMQKMAGGQSSSSSASAAVLEWENLEKSVNALNKRQQELLTTTREYERTINNIKSGKGGILYAGQTDEYNSAVKELEANKELISSYRTRQQEIINYQKQLSEQMRLVQGLRNFEQERTSLSNQRSSMELKEMRAYYKELEKTTAAEKKRADRAENQKIAKQERENAAAVKQYEKALSASANTIVQRKNKIDKLVEAEKRLVTTGQATDERIQKIRQETARLNAENEKAAKSTDNLKNKQKSLINTADQLKRAFALIFSVSQIRGYVTHLAEVRGEFEKQNKALQAILQNKDEADRLFNQITELAVKSPFQLKELVTYTKQLAAYRVESDKLFDTTKMLADVSAGLGVSMDRLILAYGQVKAANYLRGTELRQFSEAGINILGELAEYFSQLENRAVSVGEVFQMVSKRMVSFQDVEKIFQKITSEGGIFYNMQELQADTVAGMISNMRDSIDIMLNDIGKANDGVLKNSLTAVRNIVDNWRSVATLLESIGASLAAYKIAMAVLVPSQSKIVQGALQIRTAYRNVVATVISLSKGLETAERWQKGFNKAARANVYAAGAAIIIAALTAIISSIRNATREQREFNAKIAEGATSASEMSANFKRLAEQATDTTASQEEQTAALQELQSTYSELLPSQTLTIESLQKMKGNYDSVTEAIYAKIEAQTKEKLIEEAQTNQAEDVNKRIGKAAKALTDYGVSLNSARTILAKFKEETLKGGIGSSLEAIEAIESLTKEYTGKDISILSRRNDFVKLFKSLSDYQDKVKEIEGLDFTPFREYGGTEYMQSLEKQLDDVLAYKETWEKEHKDDFALTIEFQEASKQAQRDALQSFIDSLEEAKQEGQLTGAQIISTQSVIESAYKKLAAIDISPQIKQVNEYRLAVSKLTGIDFGNLFYTDLKETESVAEYISRLDSQLKEMADTIEIFNDAASKGQTVPLLQSESLLMGKTLEEFKAEYEALSQFLDLIRLFRSESKKSSGTGADDSLQILNKQIALIKEAAKKYEELRKNYNETDAAEMVRKAYEQTAKELGIADIVGEMTFDASGVIAAFEQLSTEGKAALQLALSQAMDGYRAEVDIEARVENREKIKSEIQSLFEGYNLSIELDEMGVGIDRLKAMLKALGATSEEIDLLGLSGNTLQEAIATAREKIKELRAAGGEEDLKAAKEYQEQLTALELSEARKRFSELASLREKYYSNEQKISGIEQDIAKWKAELAAMGKSGNEEMRELLKLRIQQGEETILELKSEALQLTEFWRTLFGDLEEISVKSLRGLIDISDEIIKNAAVKTDDKGQQIGYTSSYTEDGIKKQVYLTMAQYNQLIRGTKNAYDEIRDKNPFAALYDAIKEGKKSGEDGLDYLERLDLDIQAVVESSSKLAEELGTIFGADEEGASYINNAMGIIGGAASSGIGIARIASGDIVGGISQLASGLADIFSSIRGISETSLNETIEREQRSIERLQRAYERLTEAMDNAFSAPSMKANYDAALYNIEQQIDAYEKMIEAERQKKNADDDALDDYRNSMDDLQQQADELRSQYLSNLGGFGSDESMASAAQEFADAWLDAYRETGDGLDALNEKWDEYINNVIAKQLMLRGMEKYLEPVFTMLDGYLNDAQFTPEEAAALQEEINKVLPELNEFWKSIMGAFGEIGSGTSQMSGLQRGIQEITETTAQALEALLNSIRFFVADDNATLHNLYTQLFSAEEGANPMLTELRTQTRLLTSIDKRLANVIKGGHNKGGDGIKTFIQ